jgi:signal peptidase I
MTRRSGGRGGTPGRTKRRIPGWLEVVLLGVVALVVSLVVKTFFVQMFFVPSASMEPLFVKDDRILVQKVSYWGGEVERGDVVVFQDPGGWLDPGPELNGVQKVLSAVGLYPTGGHLVKRVVGVGGDHVVCCDAEGRVTVNDLPLDEPYLRDQGRQRSFDVTVPKGRLWVMGDNRANSEDSRYHQDLPGGGSIPEDRVVGKVWAIVWPLDRLDLLDRPKTYEQELDPPG